MYAGCVYFDWGMPDVIGPASVPVPAIRAGGIHRNHRNLCGSGIYGGVYSGKEDGKQEISVGAGDGTGLFWDYGTHLHGGKPWAEGIRHPFLFHIGPVRRRRDAGRDAQLTKNS